MRAAWLMLVLAACGCFPVGRALCWQSSICSDIRSKEQLLDCISMCASRGPAVLPTDRPPGPENGLLVDLLSSLGGPQDPPPRPPGPGLRGRGEDRRSYAMEHFRWGKPAGRKRRPVKLHAASVEEGGAGNVSAEAGYGQKAGGGRRRRPAAGGVARLSEEQEEGGEGEAGGEEEVVVVGMDVRDLPAQRATPGPLTGSQLSSQGTRDPATYRMNHFRWGSPSKRRNGYLAPWEETHKKPLSRFFGSSFKLVH